MTKKKAAATADGEKLIVKNKKAYFDYAVEDHFEGGLVLLGGEVKSLRDGRVEMVDAFASVERGEIWLKQLTIAPTEQARAFPHEPRRPRKVLLHAREIDQIGKRIQREGYTMIPLRIYFKNGFVKVELGLAKGKKTLDKRQDIARKSADREARAAIGRGRKGNE
ncbi:SsrA-binding protein SmpB [Pendulispora albinea]|uniref:SsrA-binding protein n=1 Tax=Pendulispora albinea TaxID=2741071 RepID=A0ABZ2LX22_9BACT